MDDRQQQAIEHLTEALDLLSCVRNPGDDPTVPIHVGDTGRPIPFTPKVIEAIADAIDSMNAYMASEGSQRNKLSAAALQVQETIASGEWSAAAVAQNDTDMWDEVNDVFAGLDLVAITKDVLDEPQTDKLAVTLALDSFLGDIADPAADEDDA
ncbi:hypothetical protein ACFC08_28790 [Streptomyces sp. NPDC056112]|uniref:hypothetical protein n=1 Tax=Streptomyces sp. NPDC056112 TaxID=3345715 RepID=UPI0035D65DCF